ncbi:MAG: M23 family metallopeptidase [Anaerolineales bacterium]|nr:MAG: M23 family metallopeptidase [Anaerolineales bacterium]
MIERLKMTSYSALVRIGLLVAVLMASGPVYAQSSTQSDDRPFRLPFAGDPGPNTWLLIQVYGNTTFAYQYRNSVYYAGQGIHFGIDLAAPCGTEILAIGDGEVYSVDSWHGAGPHNLLINHENGYASLYGHLLVRADVQPGQKVKAGEVVGLSGDPDRTCNSRPHLHLEIRDRETHAQAFNPIILIQADWERISQYGGQPVGFQQASVDTQRWTDMYDQPETKFGHPLLNDYELSWPYDW